jgi:hypothetical protein
MELLSPDHDPTPTHYFSTAGGRRPVPVDTAGVADRPEDRDLDSQPLREQHHDDDARPVVSQNDNDLNQPEVSDHDDSALSNDHDQRRDIRHHDRFEKEVERHRQRSLRRRIGHQRSPAAPLYLRRRIPGTRNGLDAQRHGEARLDSVVRRGQNRRHAPAHSRAGQRHQLLRGSAGHSEREDRVATRIRSVKTVGGAFSGVGVASYVLFIPIIAVLWKLWHRYGAYSNHVAVFLACAVVAVTWMALVVSIAISVRQQLNGRGPEISRSGIVWVASVIVVLITYVSPAGASPLAHRTATTTASYIVRPGDSLWSIAETQLGDGAKWRSIVTANRGSTIGELLDSDPEVVHVGWNLQLPNSSPEPLLVASLQSSPMATSDSPHTSLLAVHRFAAANDGSNDKDPASSRAPWPGGSLGALPLALIAKRRRDFLRQSRNEIAEEDVEATIIQLRGYDDTQLRALARAIGDGSSGLVAVQRLVAIEDATTETTTPVVAVVLASDDDATLIAYARPGYSLAVGHEGAALIDRYAVVLNGNGQCRVTNTPVETLRALALRANFDDVVIFLGPATQLDEEVAARCVSITDGPPRDTHTISFEGRTWQYSSPVLANIAPMTPRVVVAPATAGNSSRVRVELLRAQVTVTGLEEPFLSTLRRRCVEMTAYLAVHHHEPVTGDRLRTRVLGDGSDASLRTLANTATAVRRSLGSSVDGARLHPVTPAGLYQLHDVSCDLVEFHQLVNEARASSDSQSLALLQRALTLIQGEPLATALRGFEWFLAEGHLARLQRDGEWAALQLSSDAKADGDLDLAFWAIEQGRLLDPYSEALEAALHRVPRLREFGRDGAGGAKDEAVGAG